jgi:membrane fusion protein (multidrug efflux system)
MRSGLESSTGALSQIKGAPYLAAMTSGTAVLAAVGLVGGVVAGCKRPPAPPPPAPTVGAVMVRSRNVPLVKEWLATLEGSTTAEIRPQVSGYIRQVDYKEGSIVEAGQLLFTLDRRPFVAAVKKARGDYQSAVAELDKAKADVARYTPLVADHAISREQLENARAAVLANQANVQATLGGLETAQINLGWARVRSPILGLAGIAQARVGTLVNGEQVLTVVSTLDPMRASFAVSQQEYLEYSEAMNNPAAPEYANQRYFELILIDGRVYPQRARDLVVNRQIDPTTGTLQVQAFFPNPAGMLRPGLFGKVRVHAGSDRAVPVVPEQAVSQLQGRYQVAVVDDQQRVHVRQIEVGPQMEHEYPVESGLRPGERVIVEGLQNAVPGAKVNVRQGK